MRPYRPHFGTYRTIWRHPDGYDTWVTRLRAWSTLSGWRFESSSAHRKAPHSWAFRVLGEGTVGLVLDRGNTFGNIETARAPSRTTGFGKHYPESYFGSLQRGSGRLRLRTRSP